MTRTIKYRRSVRSLIALLLVTVIVSGSTYRARAAAVLPEVVVSGGEALAYLLGILGLTAGGSYVIDNKDDLMSWGNTQIDKLKTWTKENSDKVNTWGAATSQEIESTIDAWIDKAAKGVIDTGSAVWDSLKAWGGSIYDSLNSVDTTPHIGAFVQIPAGRYTAFQHTRNTWVLDVKSTVYAVAVSIPSDSYSCTRFYAISSDPFEYRDDYKSSIDSASFRTTTSSRLGYYYCSSTFGYPIVSSDFPIVTFDEAPSDVLAALLGMSVDIPADEYISVGGVSDIFDRDKTLDNIGVLVPGITAGATDVPIDWGLVGDIAGTLTDVRAGTLDIADVLADAKVFPIDKTRDTVIDSDGDLTNDKAAADVIPAVPDVAMNDYTLAGLEKAFPFCIPFDLIAFLGVLAAEPEAPSFDWPITYPTGSGTATYTLHIDLSDFDPVAKVVRSLECLGFIVGLIMITRDKMIMG